MVPSGSVPEPGSVTVAPETTDCAAPASAGGAALAGGVMVTVKLGGAAGRARASVTDSAERGVAALPGEVSEATVKAGVWGAGAGSTALAASPLPPLRVQA